ncbi:carboxypeptidase Y-deficient [Tulasnella sp. 403]|nr:carboxypeptidase Y-deficient [Tulasnella sp. 403]
MANRKELLEMFSEYDTISKKIRTLPAASGSSQDRLQAAIMMRANIFLQQHMLPLKRLAMSNQKGKNGPTSSQSSSVESDMTSNDPATPNGLTPRHADLFPYIDADAALAHSLQPLLEQEALLESYVVEATQARKFEDAKTLQTNLNEIRAEIERIARDGKIV